MLSIEKSDDYILFGFTFSLWFSVVDLKNLFDLVGVVIFDGSTFGLDVRNYFSKGAIAKTVLRPRNKLL